MKKLLFVLFLLASCKEEDNPAGPIIVVDPPRPPNRPRLKAAHILDDGSIVFVVGVAQ